jgi:signal transduction histidine kinase
VALFLAFAAASALLFFGATRAVFAGGYEAWVKPLLADYLDRLVADLGVPPDPRRAQALVERLPITLRIDGPQVHWRSHPERGAHPPHPDDDEGSARRERGALSTRFTADGHAVRFGFAELDWRERHLGRIAWPLLGLLLLTGGAYALVRRLFRPIDEIGAGAQRYGSGDFSQPIPVRRHDELGDLARQVNAMAGGLRGMLEGQRALLLAISHELRSPLTRARLNTELIADGPERQALLRDLALMGSLITDLLEGERLAAGAPALAREPTDLNDLVCGVVAESFAGAGVVLTLDGALPPLALDRPRITMLVRNLLDNACRHGAGAAEPVTLATRREDARTVCLSVRDHGPGVAPEQLARLAQPFYRPDSARTRAAGGTGLGLYLCRLVAESHGGRLTLSAAEPGLLAEVRLPV